MGCHPIRKLPFSNGSYFNGVCRALWTTSKLRKIQFFIVNLGFIRLRTASCVFALFKTAFIKIREYNLFKLKLHRTVWTVWWYTEPRCDIGVFVARPNGVCWVRRCCWVPVVPTKFSNSIMQRQVSASRSVPTSIDHWSADTTTDSLMDNILRVPCRSDAP